MNRLIECWENLDIEMKQNFLSSDNITAINSYGVIFKVGDEVQHEGVEDENETAIIKSFESSIIDEEIIVHTSRGHCKLDYLMHKE